MKKKAKVEDWDRLFSVNVRGVMLCYKHAARQMIAQGRGGRIIGASYPFDIPPLLSRRIFSIVLVLTLDPNSLGEMGWARCMFDLWEVRFRKLIRILRIQIRRAGINAKRRQVCSRRRTSFRKKNMFSLKYTSFSA